MGRNKIKIQKINNERLRQVTLNLTQVTFYKRKKGLLKKAMEISLLCGVKVCLSIVDKTQKNILYMSDDLNPKAFAEKFVIQNIVNKTYVCNKNVIFNSCSMRIFS